MDIFSQIALNFLEPAYWIAICAGAFIGLILGAIPGVSATMAVALILPFTFGMPIIFALALMLGIYSGSVYGGSIPAILFKTPGTPASAAVIFDGYAMTRNGEAGTALKVAAFSMLGGGLIGAFILLLLAPQIAVLAVKFGPSEFFAMALFGILVIVSVSEEPFFKTMVATLAGLMLSCVGMDPLSGCARFTFGCASLMEGLPFVPVLIGLFAVAGVFGSSSDELMAHGERLKSAGGALIPALGRVWRTVAKSGLIGTFIGSTPGAGCDIAAFVSYGIARNSAGDKDKFGAGEPKGVAAVESSKAACTSGALIPLLSLGIPGDSVTAILIGAFMVHGIAPGPLLIENSAPLAYSIFTTVVFVQIAVFIVAFLSIKWSALVLKCDPRFVKVSILALSMVGSYAMRNNMFDVWIAIIFGIVGVIMSRGRYPVAPFLLALILGQMAEVNFRRAFLIGGDSAAFIFERPATLFILALAALFIIFSIARRIKFHFGRIKQ